MLEVATLVPESSPQYQAGTVPYLSEVIDEARWSSPLVERACALARAQLENYIVTSNVTLPSVDIADDTVLSEVHLQVHMSDPDQTWFWTSERQAHLGGRASRLKTLLLMGDADEHRASFDYLQRVLDEDRLSDRSLF